MLLKLTEEQKPKEGFKVHVKIGERGSGKDTAGKMFLKDKLDLGAKCLLVAPTTGMAITSLKGLKVVDNLSVMDSSSFLSVVKGFDKNSFGGVWINELTFCENPRQVLKLAQVAGAEVFVTVSCERVPAWLHRNPWATGRSIEFLLSKAVLPYKTIKALEEGGNTYYDTKEELVKSIEEKGKYDN